MSWNEIIAIIVYLVISILIFRYFKGFGLIVIFLYSVVSGLFILLWNQEFWVKAWILNAIYIFLMDGLKRFRKIA